LLYFVWTEFPKLHLIHSFLYVGMLSSSVNLLQSSSVFVACFLTVFILFPIVFSQQLSKK